MVRWKRVVSWGIGLVVGAIVVLAAIAAIGVRLSRELWAWRWLLPTVIVTQEGVADDEAAPVPPAGVLEKTTYKAPLGDNVAYVTPLRTDGKKRPAVLWAHGGFGGIDSWFYEEVDPDNDQSGQAFRDAGLVVMYPSWRGENDNPGQYEMFYGEVDDLLAARDHLRARPDVDPDRVYLVGHSVGATNTLLAAIVDDGFRAAVCFGPWLEMPEDVDALTQIEISGARVPFDPRNTVEAALRSPGRFLGQVERPTWLIEGELAVDVELEELIDDVGNDALHVALIPGGDHFTILHSATRLIAGKIASSVDGELDITAAELAESFQKRPRLVDP